ncbi:LLM class flavin-dependent oxidoreductase [Aggregatilinea lenta]|uniref:LLM class flavin-dependent oxidoreductase n=1 Tax=Aggregatilinea lenta TaxID=913108 RepID=UPI000E5A88E2|nr:LLM class flavin-dependent oxidoreductase [Aggregatilinea lenta]
MDYGVLVDPLLKPGDLIALARQVEQAGFTHFWYPDEKFFRECYVGLTLVAAHTSRIQLGPCVTDPYSRHPIMTAAAIGTLAEVAPGRVWLGLGAGGRGLKAMGITQDRPARAIREAIEVIRGLLAGQSVNYEGEVIRLEDRPLDFTPTESVRIMIGTGHGRYTQQLAGEVADAAMVANYASPDVLDRALVWVRKGAQRAGRSLDDLTLISRVDVAVHADRATARAAVAPKVLSALRSSYPELAYLDVLPPFEMPSELVRVLGKKDYKTRAYYADPAHSAPLIPDVLIDHLAVAGTPAEVTARLRAIGAMGFGQIAIRAVPAGDQTLQSCLDLVATDVLPGLN